MGVAGALSGEYGADGLGFEDEESRMSVSEFKQAMYSGNVWNEYVELDEVECVFRSILKCVYLVLFISGFVLYCFFIRFHVQFQNILSFNIQFRNQNFLSFSRIFEKVKLYPFHRRKVDSLFVVVGRNYIYYRSVFED